MNVWNFHPHIRPPLDRRSNEAPVITFHSFRGGVGRSTAVAFVAKLLIDQGKRVFVVDANLEAPGVHALLTKYEPTLGFIDFINDYNDFIKGWAFEGVGLNRIGMENYVLRGDTRIDPDGLLDVMPAGDIMSPSYLRKLSEPDWDKLEAESHSVLHELFQRIRMIYSPDFILVDSSTGCTNLAGHLLFRHSTMNLLILTPQPRREYGLYLFSPSIRKTEGRVNYRYVPSLLSRDQYEREQQLGQLIEVLGDTLYGHDKELLMDLRGEMIELSLMRTNVLENIRREDLQDSLLQSRFLPLAKAVLETVQDVKVETASKRLEMFINLKLPRLEETGYSESDFVYVEDFRRRFLLPPTAAKLLEKSKIIIIGRKGSGKSSLFSTLLRFKEELNFRDMEDFEPESLIGYNGGGGEGHGGQNGVDRERVVIQSTVWEGLYAMQQRHQDTLSEGLFWRAFWMSYLLERFQGRNDFALTQFEQSLRIEGILQMEKDLIRQDGLLERRDRYQLVLYDNLETIAQDNPQLRTVIIQSLVQLWFELRDRGVYHLVPKLFIRTDIFNQFKFTNLSHRSPNVVEIRWDQDTLWRMILKTLLSGSVDLQEELKEHWAKDQMKQHDRLDPDPLWNGREDEGMGLDITRSEEGIRFMVNYVFNERYNSRKDAAGGTLKKSPLMYNWFHNRLRDGQQEVYPREMMQLISGLYNRLVEQEDLMQVFEKHYGIFPVESIRRKNSVLKQVAENKWRGFTDEFSEYEGSIRSVQTFIEGHLKKGQKKMNFTEQEMRTFLEDQQIDHDVAYDELVQIGLLERIAANVPEYYIPQIYQFALGLRFE